MDPLYKPQGVEQRWQQTWEEEGLYGADPDAPGETFVVMHPPPNISGSLTIGHCLQLSLEGPQLRYARVDDVQHHRPTAQLMQRLLAAKRDLRLPQELAKLDRYACLILDDIGYVQHDQDEMEILFTLLSERYERKTVMISTNLVFSEWTRIFKSPMTTMAAIDRVVHHSVIVDMMAVDSYRAKEATISNQQATSIPPDAATGTTTNEPKVSPVTSENGGQ
jgi:hypothetical protein